MLVYGVTDSTRFGGVIYHFQLAYGVCRTYHIWHAHVFGTMFKVEESLSIVIWIFYREVFLRISYN